MLSLRVGGITRYEMMIPPRMTLTQRPREALVGDPSVLIGREYIARISTSVNVARKRACLYRAHSVPSGQSALPRDSVNSVC